jgi:hypothetical protein
VELACLAPSLHNTQPWRWRIVGAHSIELYADTSRQLRVADPHGRHLVISCGTALHHAEVAARALGLAAEVALASPGAGDLLATVALAESGTQPAALDDLEALQRRRTDRRRFTSWPIPETRLAHLAESAAAGRGVYVMPVVEATARHHTEQLLARARHVQSADPAYLHEQESWVDHGAYDGIPATNAVPGSPRRGETHLPRYDTAVRVDTAPSEALETSDGILAICTKGDDRADWLHAGQALSALWLRAAKQGLALVPLSQVTEVEETRAALHVEVFGGMARPQILVRVGWQEISRAPLPPTPRRPVGEVLID